MGLDQMEPAPGGGYTIFTDDGSSWPVTGVQEYVKWRDIAYIDSLFLKSDSLCISFQGDGRPPSCVGITISMEGDTLFFYDTAGVAFPVVRGDTININEVVTAGDNWGTQVAATDNSIGGDGSGSNPLSVNWPDTARWGKDSVGEPDHDWYRLGTNLPPTNINDSLYTNSKIEINTNGSVKEAIKINTGSGDWNYITWDRFGDRWSMGMEQFGANFSWRHKSIGGSVGDYIQFRPGYVQSGFDNAIIELNSNGDIELNNYESGRDDGTPVNVFHATSGGILQLSPISSLPGDGTGTDDQQISISGHTITLEDGGSVVIPDTVDGTGTDNQLISILGHTVTLENGGSIIIPDTVAGPQDIYRSGDSIKLTGSSSFILDTAVGSGDADWYRAQFAAPPGDITNHIYTHGNVLIGKDTLTGGEALQFGGTENQSKINLGRGGRVKTHTFNNIDEYWRWGELFLNWGLEYYDGTNTTTLFRANTDINVGSNLKMFFREDDIWLGDYLSSRNDLIQAKNFLHTDDDGVIRSSPIDSIFSGIQDSVGLDVQQLSKNEDTIFLERGGWVLDSDSIISDTQQLSISGDTLFLSRGGFAVLPEGFFDTDSQQISIVDHTITLERGGSIVIPDTVDGTGTDDQTLSYNLATNDLTIEDGNTVNIPGDGNDVSWAWAKTSIPRAPPINSFTGLEENIFTHARVVIGGYNYIGPYALQLIDDDQTPSVNKGILLTGNRSNIRFEDYEGDHWTFDSWASDTADNVKIFTLSGQNDGVQGEYIQIASQTTNDTVGAHLYIDGNEELIGFHKYFDGRKDSVMHTYRMLHIDNGGDIWTIPLDSLSFGGGGNSDSSLYTPWSGVYDKPADFDDNIDNVDDADADPANELQLWSFSRVGSDHIIDLENNSLDAIFREGSGIVFTTGGTNNNYLTIDAIDNSTTNEIQTLAQNETPGEIIISGANTIDVTELTQDQVDDLFIHANHTNITAVYDDANNRIELTGSVAGSVDWDDITNIPAGFADDIDNVNDADASATNELQTWTFTSTAIDHIIDLSSVGTDAIFREGAGISLTSSGGSGNYLTIENTRYYDLKEDLKTKPIDPSAEQDEQFVTYDPSTDAVERIAFDALPKWGIVGDIGSPTEKISSENIRWYGMTGVVTEWDAANDWLKIHLDGTEFPVESSPERDELLLFYDPSIDWIERGAAEEMIADWLHHHIEHTNHTGLTFLYDDANNQYEFTVTSSSVPWTDITGKPAGFDDNIDNVNDADANPANELQTLSVGTGLDVTGSGTSSMDVDLDFSEIPIDITAEGDEYFIIYDPSTGNEERLEYDDVIGAGGWTAVVDNGGNPVIPAGGTLQIAGDGILRTVGDAVNDALEVEIDWAGTSSMSNPVTTDEIIVNDAGVDKRMDIGVLHGRLSGNGGSPVDVPLTGGVATFDGSDAGLDVIAGGGTGILDLTLDWGGTTLDNNPEGDELILMQDGYGTPEHMNIRYLTSAGLNGMKQGSSRTFTSPNYTKWTFSGESEINAQNTMIEWDATNNRIDIDANGTVRVVFSCEVHGGGNSGVRVQIRENGTAKFEGAVIPNFANYFTFEFVETVSSTSYFEVYVLTLNSSNNLVNPTFYAEFVSD